MKNCRNKIITEPFTFFMLREVQISLLPLKVSEIINYLIKYFRNLFYSFVWTSVIVFFFAKYNTFKKSLCFLIFLQVDTMLYVPIGMVSITIGNILCVTYVNNIYLSLKFHQTITQCFEHDVSNSFWWCI